MGRLRPRFQSLLSYYHLCHNHPERLGLLCSIRVAQRHAMHRLHAMGGMHLPNSMWCQQSHSSREHFDRS